MRGFCRSLSVCKWPGPNSTTGRDLRKSALIIAARFIRLPRCHHMVATEAGVGVHACRGPLTLMCNSVQLAGRWI